MVTNTPINRNNVVSHRQSHTHHGASVHHPLQAHPLVVKIISIFPCSHFGLIIKYVKCAVTTNLVSFLKWLEYGQMISYLHFSRMYYQKLQNQKMVKSIRKLGNHTTRLIDFFIIKMIILLENDSILLKNWK